MKRKQDKDFFKALYRGFAMPLCEVDCGLKCGPHNDYGVPICCDIHQVIPSAFDLEWRYLKDNTDLWQPWSSAGSSDLKLDEELLDGQVLLACKGYQECQRDFRTLTCRAFPFYPYMNSQGVFLGLAYYPEFRFGCWIISNLEIVSQAYKEGFYQAFQRVFEFYPDYRQNYIDYSRYERETAAKEDENLVLMDFSGNVFLIDPQTEEKSQVQYKELSAFGPFEITRELRFPNE